MHNVIYYYHIPPIINHLMHLTGKEHVKREYVILKMTRDDEIWLD